MIQTIDSHCHLDALSPSSQTTIITNSQYVNKFINPDIMLWYQKEQLLENLLSYSNVYVGISVHPMFLEEFVQKIYHKELDQKNIIQLFSETIETLYQEINKQHPNKIVAVGECGLDYFHLKKLHKKSPNFNFWLTLQHELFRSHIKFAIQKNLPLILHNRGAYQEMIKILQEEAQPNLSGIMHAFSGAPNDLSYFIKHNFGIGFGPRSIDKDGEPFTTLVQNTPQEHMILETDAPYMPAKRVLEKRSYSIPDDIILAAEKLAELKNLSLEEILQINNNNCIRIFKI